MQAPIALALLVAAQTAAPVQATPPWVQALVGAGIAVLSAVLGWVGARTPEAKSAALANTINAIPTAWHGVVQANPSLPNAALVQQVLDAAALFAGRALTAAEETSARRKIEETAPARAPGATLMARTAADAIVLQKSTTATTPAK